MFPTFLNIPLRLGDIRQKADIPRIGLKESIHHLIHLVVTTSYGEVRHDPEFGCDIWDTDFENIYNPHSFRESLRKSLQNSLKNNEKRLANINVDLQIEQVELSSKIANRRIKTRVMIYVTGMVEKTNEPFRHQELFFIGPLSYY